VLGEASRSALLSEEPLSLGGELVGDVGLGPEFPADGRRRRRTKGMRMTKPVRPRADAGEMTRPVVREDEGAGRDGKNFKATA
jgi:hypothetical protein